MSSLGHKRKNYFFIKTLPPWIHRCCLFQRYNEMNFKSESPKFFQQFKKKKGNKTMTEKLGICLILTLNKIKKIWSFKNPQRWVNEGRQWDEVKKLMDMGEEAIWVFFFKGRSTREREREREDMKLRETHLFLRFCFWLLYTDLAYR